MSWAKVITSEGTADEMLNNDKINYNNGNMILLSDACLLTLGSGSNSMSHEECTEIFSWILRFPSDERFSTISFMLVSSFV